MPTGGNDARPGHLDRHAPVEPREVQLDRLRRAREVGDAQHRFAVVLAQVREHLPVARLEEHERAASERLEALADLDQAARPAEQRRGAARLRLDVDRLVAVDRVHDRRQIELLRVGAREPGVAVRAPLHRRPHAVPVAEVDVVAHADLVAVVDDRRARHREQEERHQLDALAVVLEQRREPAADADVDAHPRVGREHLVHVVALAVGDHLERQLVVVAQEDRPLAVGRDVGRLAHDLDHRVAVLLRDGEEEARHQREVERHVALVAVAEVLAHVLGPLVGLGEQDAAGVTGVERGADALDHRVGRREVLVVRALALAEVGDRVEAEPVDAHVEPELHGADHRPQHLRVVEVEVGLVAEEAVPVVRLRDRVPRPVRRLGVGEDDARAGVAVRVVAPDVVVALRRALRRAPRRLEPRVLVGRVVHDELGDHLEVAPVRLADEVPEVVARAVRGVDVVVVGHVVAVVAHRRRVERQQPDGGDAEVLDVVEPLGQAAEVADAVVVGVEERLHVQLVDHRVLEPAVRRQGPPGRRAALAGCG